MGNPYSTSLVAIHQPNFFPWLGYFDKIINSDIFVFLDAVSYPKSGHSMGTWTNRVKCQVQGQAQWLTCPVVRKSGIQLIKDVKIDYTRDWQNRLIKTLRFNYARTIFFQETMSWLEPMVMRKCDFISEYNVQNIMAICSLLGLQKNFVLQSHLGTKKTSTDLILEIVFHVQGERYLCGGGSSGYLEVDKFRQTGIELIYQRFIHPNYPQRTNKPFISGLSILDAFMNLGIDGTRALLVKERRSLQ